MKRSCLWLIVTFGWLASGAAGQDPASAVKVSDLADYRTVATAKTTTIAKTVARAGLPGYLGVQAVVDDRGRVRAGAVALDSPAAKAGIVQGDELLRLNGAPIPDVAAFREALLGYAPGDALVVDVKRNGKELQLKTTLGAVSRPFKMGESRGVLGVQTGAAPDGEGIVVKAVTSGQPAEKAGLKAGDVVVKIDGQVVTTPNSLNDALYGKKPGELVVVTVRRDGQDHDLKVPLAADTSAKAKVGSWDTRTLAAWKKNVYRLAVVPIEFADIKHNPQITIQHWEQALFSSGTYRDKSATGQRVYGSLNDYYHEQSFGKLRVEGKVFNFVPVAKKRGDYGQSTTGPAKTALLSEALDLLYQREGKDALNNFDGLFFLYCGGRVPTNRGSLYWPHRSSFTHQGKRWSYFISSEGGTTMSSISVICHEFGHMLGLPDLYARPENPGSEGVGAWCAMSNQIGNGRPQHFSAWSKEQLGWITPAIIDPTVPQKLILAPIEDSPKECFKVLVRRDGSEYFLLENRKKKGFDADLPGEGLLIWRVVGGKPFLEEAHGVEGPPGPRVFVQSVPFPSAANTSFTPYTIPSSRSQLGGGLPVWITNIRRLPDARIAFWIGYEIY
ncbi:MAG: M6 family metalloprotease domain-containing protein [Gemmataceae bacterium]|nr:M6 family metalloprotease domain-containing protein [Gemmataceae bacterium]